MPKLTALITILLFCGLAASAQTARVSGSLTDDQKKGVSNAVVMLLTPKDSVLYQFTRTGADGKYMFNEVKEADYIMITTHPSYADVVDNINIKGNTEIPPLTVVSKSKLLQEVIVKSGNAMRIKGDTTIYTADSFQVSANANVEELLKKMPGFQVDKNGQIKSMGQVVEKVLVDGEEFFGDDPGMAVKNLRADAVKEVQVFDKKSDQAEFTGIDDGNTKKTINLKLKEDKKKGFFGKIDLSGGLQKHIDHRYNNNILFSSFKGKRKLTGFFLNGNTGQDGLSWQDSEKFGGGDNENFSMSMDDNGDVSYSWNGGNNDEEPYVNTDNGFIKNTNIGVQYSNKWNDKQTLNFSPKYNSQVYNNNMNRFSQSSYLDSIFKETSTTNTNVNRNNFKSSLIYDAKLDSNNSLRVVAKVNIYHTETSERRNSFTTNEDDVLKNRADRFLTTNTDKQSFSASVLFKHRFKKPRRTLSINADWNLLANDGNNYVKSLNEVYKDALPISSQAIDQFKDNERSTQKIGTRLVYTEPLSKKYSMELAYELSYTSGKNNQRTYSYSPVSKEYDVEVDSLTNDFKQRITVNRPSLRINYADKKLKYNFGLGVGLTHFDLLDISINKDYIRNFTNFFPSATLNYTYKTQRNLRFNYNGYTTQPNINQLQPLKNNNDYFNQYIGNPNLKPSFTNSFNLSHNTYDFLTDRFTYQSINFRTVSNSITNNRIIDYDSAKTTTQPINTKGNYSFNAYMGMGFKSKKLNTRFNIGPNMNYYRSADVLNSITNYSKTLGAGLNFYISKSKDKKYDISISNNYAYNSNKNSRSNNKTNYSMYTLSVDGTVYFTKSLSLQTDYEYITRQKIYEGDRNLNIQIWNARLQQTFKKDEFTLYIKVRDILNQNVGIDRRFDGTTYTETRNDRLQRYWLLGFAWNFKNAGAKAK